MSAGLVLSYTFSIISLYWGSNWGNGTALVLSVYHRDMGRSEGPQGAIPVFHIIIT